VRDDARGEARDPETRQPAFEIGSTGRRLGLAVSPVRPAVGSARQIARTVEPIAHELRGVLAFNDKPLVSIDFNHDPSSSIYDASLTKVIEEKLVKIVAWYDNEWGFSNRMLDTTAALMAAA